MRPLLLALSLAPVLTHAGAPLTAVLLPNRTLALLVVLALFYFGFRWRVR